MVPRCTSTPVSAALALVLVLGKRVGWPRESVKPHNVPMVALGAGLLWFGWFGFNAGSELTADGVTALAFINTQVATAAALLGWLVVEWLRDGKPTLVGASSGAVAGLVAITPACGVHHPVRGGAARPRRRRGLRAGGRPEVPARLRRLARRGRRALRRRVDRLAVDRPVRHRPRSTRWSASDGLFYGGGATQLGRQALAAPSSRSTRSRSPSLSATDRQDDRASGSPPRPRSRASTSPSTRRARTTSRPLRAAAAARSPWPASAPSPAGSPTGGRARRPVSEKVAG